MKLEVANGLTSRSVLVALERPIGRPRHVVNGAEGERVLPPQAVRQNQVTPEDPIRFRRHLGLRNRWSVRPATRGLGYDCGSIVRATTATASWRRPMDFRGNGVYISGGALTVIVIILLLIWLL